MSIISSQFVPPSPSPPGSTSPFSTSASLSLPCHQVHLYHFSRLYIYIYSLIYDNCFLVAQDIQPKVLLQLHHSIPTKPWSYVLILLLICLQIKKLRVRVIKQLSQVTYAQIMIKSSHGLSPGLSSSKCKPLPGHACFPEAKPLPSRNLPSGKSETVTCIVCWNETVW